jgi:uncharacterized protein (DUF58 family)
MMTRLRVILLLTAACLAGALVSGRSIFYSLFYTLTAILALSLFWAWTGVHWLAMRRQIRARHAQVGRSIEERVFVRNLGLFPKLWLEVRDHSTLSGHRASFALSNLGVRSEYMWSVHTTCQERGRFAVGPVTVTSGDPFGLFLLRRELAETTSIVVYPATFDLRVFPLPAGQLTGGDALRRRTHYVTTNAASVRDYAPGDGFNRIHWPSTARRDRLIVKEFELDPLSDIWVVLDMAQAAHFDAGVYEWRQQVQDLDRSAPWARRSKINLPPNTEEYAVSIAASISQYFLRVDRSLGLIACGHRREILQPDRGERQLNRIMETLAVLRARCDLPLRDVLATETVNLARGATLIIITASTDVNWAIAARHLDRSGLQIVAILIDPETFGAPAGMAQVSRQLTWGGVPSYLVRKNDVIQDVLSRPVYLRRPV